MARRWIEAGGVFQFLFMGAASRSLRGERGIVCPKCEQTTLRAYFHAFDRENQMGTIWVWCPECRTTAHLSRVTPKVALGPDPFAELSRDEFARLETDSSKHLLDRLERLWTQGQLDPPCG
jgi:hypothetical protein